jgi:hypothetical protein
MFAFLAVSFALHLADVNLGIRAAAKIPIITITINISTNVNHFLFFILIGSLNFINFYRKIKAIFA